MDNTQPTLARWTLGEALRRLRQAKGISRTEAAEAIGYGRHTIRRIEEGLQSTKPPVVKDLCDLYGAPPEQRSELCRMALEGGKRGWWESHKKGVKPKWKMFAEAEQDASIIRTWEPEYIPGLVQVPEYFQALQSTSIDYDAELAEMSREFRFTRQELLWNRDPLPQMSMLIGESALRYLTNLPDVQSLQLQRLREVTKLPTIDVRVVTSLHSAMTGAFTILTPAHKAKGTFVYMDALDGCRYVEDHDIVSTYQQTFDAVHKAASPIEEYIP